MKFSFVPRVSHRARREEMPTFTIARLWKDASASTVEISNAFDRNYHYQSEQELRWHLAERFELPVQAVTLQSH